MKCDQFRYWLQGFFELHGVTALTAEQTATVARHLGMVFLHDLDPKAGDAAEQAKLNAAHKGETKWRC